MKLNALIGSWFLVLALAVMPLQGVFAMAGTDHIVTSHTQALSSASDCHHDGAGNIESEDHQPGHSLHCGMMGHCCAAIDLSRLWTDSVSRGQLSGLPERALLPIVLSPEIKPPRVL